MVSAVANYSAKSMRESYLICRSAPNLFTDDFSLEFFGSELLEFWINFGSWHREKQMKIVSACLAGIPCRYDGKSNPHEKVIEWIESGEAIAVCPEELGGLPTPRKRAEIQEDKVINIDGEDVTEAFQKGAEMALKIAKENGVNEAVLKSKSPSCGCGKIYDGTFSEKLVDGDGVFAKFLISENIKVRDEQNL